MSDITTWTEAYEAFNEFLDFDDSNTVIIVGLEFAPSDILKKCDPIAYRCFFNDFMDSLNIDTDELEGWDND